MRPIERISGLLEEHVAIPASCLGIGLFSVWTELSFINPPIAYSGAPDNLFQLFNMGTVALALAVAVFMRTRRTKRTLVSDGRNIVLALSLLWFSTCSAFVATSLDLQSAQLMVVSAVVGGFGITLLFVMWFEVVSHLKPTQLLLCYSLGAIGRVFLIWLCSGMSMDRLWFSLCGIAFLAVVTLRFARDSVAGDAPEVMGACGGATGSNPEGRCSFPVRPLLFVLTGTLVLSFVMGIQNASWGINGNPGVLVACAAVVLVVLLKGEFFEFKWLWRASMACMVATIGFLAFGAGWLPLSGFLVCMAYVLCVMLMYSILGDLVYRSFYNSTFLFSAELAIELTAGHAGDAVARWTKSLDPSNFPAVTTLAGIVLILLFAAASIGTFSNLDSKDKWSAIIRKPFAQDVDVLLERSRLGLRCRELAQEAGLSRREEEVLLLLAQKKKPSVIAKHLVIEVSTVNTHKKHIYQKLDVHSAQELQARIGSMEEKPS